MSSTRLYSANRIKKAGKVLMDRDLHSELSVIEAEDVLTYWRALSSRVIYKFQYHLTAILTFGKIKGIVSHRLKRVPSIIYKLKRFYPSMQLSTMQDIAGIRVVLTNTDEVYALKHELESKPSPKFILKGIDDYITFPKYDGYRSLHMNFKFVAELPEEQEIDGINVEIQIRTTLQHIWATTVETTGTFIEFSLKSNEGPPEWIEFFQLASVAFSKLEAMPVIEKYNNIPEYEIYKELISQYKSLDIEKKLSAFKVATNYINSKEYNEGSYNLLILNLDSRMLNSKNFIDSQTANIEYTQIERRIQNGENLQVVLVETKNVMELREAYPNYFLDIGEFINTMSEIEKQIDDEPFNKNLNF